MVGLYLKGKLMDKFFKMFLSLALTTLVVALIVLAWVVAQAIGGWLGWAVDAVIIILFFIIWRHID